MFLPFGILLLDCLPEPVHLLAQLHERLLCGIGFLSSFNGGKEIRFFRSIFLVFTTILAIVHGICAPMLLAEVAMHLGASFLGNLAHRLSTRLLVSILALVRSYLVGLCIGSFLGIIGLNSLERQEKQMHVHDCHVFLVKVELILPHMRAHPKNVTC
jgi:hypothetical protein